VQRVEEKRCEDRDGNGRKGMVEAWQGRNTRAEEEV
jgi:hypothetical protein